jgi:hypothetical protein
MHLPQIRCYHPDGLQLPFTFYILSKGDNAGMPGFTPWSYSFALLCKNQEHFDFFFWLCCGLFKAGKFKIHQRGTIIPFINKSDVRDVIGQAAPFIYEHWQQYQKIMQALTKLEVRKVTLMEQLKATEKLQSYLIRSCFAK